ncbi:glutamate-rich protein 6 [Esox lucius]|uniref:glutamate-rich protein 6 n=1 Tax=Esox lucius TaxID=8010 RepID=UPI001476F808|nr:glutamate-rich protein 6 [Esox lucius]
MGDFRRRLSNHLLQTVQQAFDCKRKAFLPSDGRQRRIKLLGPVEELSIHPDLGDMCLSGNKAVDFTFIIMEDKDVEPNLLAIYTNRGQSTCYHPSGLIWVNLTQLGGTCCIVSGTLRRRWNWLDIEPHVQAPPFQPICLVLGLNISVRIQTQERIDLNFTSRRSGVRFDVGSKFKLTHPEGLVRPWPDILQKHLQLKSLEIYSLLDRIQTCMVYQHSKPTTIISSLDTALLLRYRDSGGQTNIRIKSHVL